MLLFEKKIERRQFINESFFNFMNNLLQTFMYYCEL